MRNVALAVTVGAALVGSPAFAADMATKAPPSAPAPAPTWTGFYLGGEFGAGWGDRAVNFSPNDPASASLFSGTSGFAGQQPLATSQRLSRSGPVGGVEIGYNWQAGANWLVGLEADFSLSGISGQASGPTSNLLGGVGPITQSTNAKQSTDWYGTVRGRAGFLVTPNLLLFATGGFAYGRVADSANYLTSFPGIVISNVPAGGFGFSCTSNVTCFAGSSSAVRTGFTAGGGAEWLLDQHWSAKIEYQFVDLGTQTVRVTALSAAGIGLPPGTIPASFNAAFRDQFHVVRVGLNYRY